MLRLACDVGGTFTDLALASGDELKLFKAPTTPGDPVEGVLAAIRLAAEDRGMGVPAFPVTVATFVHGTTRAINAILTGTTARTAFLTTEGHRDILLLREGGRLDPYDNRQSFPRPYVPRALTFEVPERIGADGRVVRPLDEAAVSRSSAGSDAEDRGGRRLPAVVDRQSGPRADGRRDPRRSPSRSAVHAVASPQSDRPRIPPRLRDLHRCLPEAADGTLPARSCRAAAGRGLRRPTADGHQPGRRDGRRRCRRAPIHAINSGPSMAPVAGRISRPGRGIR